MSNDLHWTPDTARLDSLELWEHNPKWMSKRRAERLLESWRDLDQYQTLAVGPSGECYDGHQRIKTLLSAGYPGDYEVKVLRSSRALTDDERRRVILESTVGTVGNLDWDKLAAWDASTLDSAGIDAEFLATLNDDAANLAKLLEAEAPHTEGDTEPQIDRAEELREKWGVELGQMWACGDQHRIICGDCTDEDVVARVMQGEKADMVIADPPYGLNIVSADGYVGGDEGPDGMIPFGGVKKKRKGYVGGGEGDSLRHGHYAIQESKKGLGSIGAANLVDVGKYMPIVGDETTETAIKAVTFYLEAYPNAAQFWFGGNYYTDALFPSPCWVVWDKETTGNFADCEMAWSNLNRAARLFRHRWNGMLRDSEHGRRMHPSQKPAALATFIMQTFGEVGNIVVDPFAGAGWVVIGAEEAKFKARVIEIVPEYVAVTLQRFQDHTGIMPVLLEDTQ